LDPSGQVLEVIDFEPDFAPLTIEILTPADFCDVCDFDALLRSLSTDGHPWLSVTGPYSSPPSSEGAYAKPGRIIIDGPGKNERSVCEWVQFCLTGGFGWGATVGMGVAWDSKGNLALIFVGGVGGGTPGISAGPAVGVATTDLWGLEGVGIQVGGSWGIGVDYLTGEDAGVWSGAEVQQGCPWPEIHGIVTKTGIVPVRSLIDAIGRAFGYGIDAISNALGFGDDPDESPGAGGSW